MNSSDFADPNGANGYPPPRPQHRRGAGFFRFKWWARRYWWIVALCIMVGLGIVDFISLTSKPQYVSYSRMMVGGSVALPQSSIYNDSLAMVNFYGTQVALMKSPQIVNQAVDRVTSSHPEITVDPNADVDASLELRTSMFDLRVVANNPDYAKVLLEADMDAYLASKRELKNQTTDEAVSAITEEISRLDAELRADDQGLLEFQDHNNVVFVEEQSSSAATYLVGLNNELAQLNKEHDLLAMESKDPITSVENMQDGTGNGRAGDVNAAIEKALPGVASEQNADTILTQQDVIQKLKIAREQYAENLKDAHPKIKDLDDSIRNAEKFLETLKDRSKTSRDARREDFELRIKNVEAQIAAQNTKSLELSKRLATYQELRGKRERDYALYTQYKASINNVDLNKSLDQANVVVWEAASPAKEINHNLLLRLLYGVAGGIAVGLVIIFIIIRLDDKIDSPLDVEEHIDFPLVGAVPLARLDKKSRRVPLVVEDDVRHEFIEHHRDIRSNILFGRADASRNRSLMITSAAPGEGKSTLAANLAATFAFSGIRVLLIDADLRRGIQHNIFGVTAKPGLSEYLKGDITLQDAVKHTKVPNLDLLTRGKVPPSAGDLLLSSSIDELNQESMLLYDIVLWDTAPLFAAHDAADLCSRLDGVIFLARVRHSTVTLVNAALNELTQRNARIFGVVLNAVQSGQPGHYEKYRYKEYISAGS